MFSKEKDNIEMLYGAYKKLKSYYHYNKNFLFMRDKIASFEYDEKKMDSTIEFLAKLLKNPSGYKKEINGWIDSIDYYLLPKGFKDTSSGDKITTSFLSPKSLNKVNFFINMPIELHLLETLWTLFVAKISFDVNIIQECSYGNRVDDNNLFDKSNSLKKSINFKKNNLFQYYFPQYCKWKNHAIDAIEHYKDEKNTVLLSLDIRNFYYSIIWKFNLLDEILSDSRLDEFKELTVIMEMIFQKFTQKISEVRNIVHNIHNKENILPIGLFSSMIIANLFMTKYDVKIKKNEKVLYYGRYVDDLLILIDVDNSLVKNNIKELEILLIDNQFVIKKGLKEYCIFGYDNLIIQKEKLKAIFFKRRENEAILSHLKKTIVIPSQTNILPSAYVKLEDFEELAYALDNFSFDKKIKDIDKLEINKYKLALYMSDLVRSNTYQTDKTTDKEEELQIKEKKDKIIKFFTSVAAIEYSSNWINIFYFVLLSSNESREEWNDLENGIRSSIKELMVHSLEDIKKEKLRQIKLKLKYDLNYLLEISMATALAINPSYLNIGKETEANKQKVLECCYKIRNANLFNHYLVSFPLANYFDEIDKNIDLSKIKLETMIMREYKLEDSRKIRFSPRFINYDELFQYYFIHNIYSGNPHASNASINKIRDLFFKINQINIYYSSPLAINIVEEKGKFKDYKFIKIILNNKTRDLNKIRIGIANIKLDMDSCCMGLANTPVIRNRLDFLSFLQISYKSAEEKIDYLVFPELYLPISWMQDVLSFSRKTGITVISGIQYVCDNTKARNMVCIFTRVKSGKFNTSCVIAREKNNYAPLEKLLLPTKGFKVEDRTLPIYTCFEDGGVRFGLFLCYEFTDICARALFKDEVDIIFIPEINHDTTYFSNIIESMSRDLHVFMVQSNTSIYGDSRITGPYSRDQRNIVQIKGGDNDSLIVGTINIKEVIDARKNERNKMKNDIEQIRRMNANEKLKKYQELKGNSQLKISKLSARSYDE